MQITRRITTALAAAAVTVLCGVAAAGPVAADEVDPGGDDVVVGAPGPVVDDEEESYEGRNYQPGVEPTGDGKWRAYLKTPSRFVELEVGVYESKKEARKAAKAAAEEANGVMDGPGCDPPFVLC